MEDPAQLVHAGYSCGWVIHGGGNGLQRDVNDLQDPKFHILLQGSGGTEVEGLANFSASPRGKAIPLSTLPAAGFLRERTGPHAGEHGVLHGGSLPGRRASWCR